MTLLVTLPFAVPALWDVIRMRAGGEAGAFIYLLKPVENQYWYLLLGATTVGLAWLGVSLVSRSPSEFRLSPISAWIALLLLCQLVSAHFSSEPLHSYKGLLLPVAFYLSCGFAMVLRPRIVAIEKTFLLLLVAAALVSIYALAQNRGFEILPYSRTAAGTDDELTGKQLIASTFGHPNYMASFLAPLVFWCTYFILAPPARLIRGIAIICGVLMLAALVVGGTRGPWLAVVVAGVPFYAILTFSPAYRRPLLFTAGVAIFVSLLLLLIPNPLVNVQFDLQKRLIGSKEIAARFYYWLMAIEMVKAHPWLGVGYGKFDVLFWDFADAFQQQPKSEYFRYVLQESIRGIRPGYVHNDHLQILTETGLLGACAWLGMWATLIYQGVRNVRLRLSSKSAMLLSATLLASLICFAVDGLTNFPLHVPVSGMLFWVSVGFWTSIYDETGSIPDDTSKPSLTA